MKRIMFLLTLIFPLLTVYSCGQTRESSKANDDQQKELKGIIRAYSDKVEEILEKNEILTSFDFFLYDITRDGVPELWVDHGSCEADRYLDIYTYENRHAKLLYNCGIDHAEFHQGKDYILMWQAHMGLSDWHHFTYDGKIKDTIVFEQHLKEEQIVLDYIEPQEPEVPSFASNEQTEDVEEYIAGVVSRLLVEEGNNR